MHNTGFSLLEVLVIICISTILATIGMQQWRSLQLRNELITSTQQLAYFLNEVQVIAYTHNETYNLYLFSSPWCLTITKGDRPSSCYQGELQFINSNNSVVISGFTDKKTISFWGRRNMAQTTSFQLQNSIGISKVFVSFRGRIRFCSHNNYLAGLPPC